MSHGDGVHRAEYNPDNTNGYCVLDEGWGEPDGKLKADRNCRNDVMSSRRVSIMQCVPNGKSRINEYNPSFADLLVDPQKEYAS